MDDSNTPQSDNSTKYKAQHTENGGKTRSRATVTKNQSESDHCDKNPNHRLPQSKWWHRVDWSQVFLDGVLIIIGIRLACIYSGQLSQMVESNKTSRDAFTASSRAWISPMSAGFKETPKPRNPLQFGVQYGNPGHSPALDVRPIYKIRSVPASSFDDNSIKASIEADDVCHGVLEAPGADAIYPEQPNGYRLDFTLKEPNFIDDPDIFDGKKVFILEMCFAYKTINSLRHTSFCYFYRSGTTLPNQWNVCNAGNHAD